MHALSLLPFLLVIACCSAPSIRGANVPNSAVPELPPRFPRPSAAPGFVTLLTGFYNYMCPQNGTWQFDGSSGQVFDISNLFDLGEFTNIQFDAYTDLSDSQTTNPLDPTFAAKVERKYGINLLGKYSDSKGETGGFNQVVVDFSSTGGGTVVTVIRVDAKSPSSTTAVDWLDLGATYGSLAQTVFLIGTVGGLQPIDDCEPSYPNTQSPFCAQLWGFPS